MPEPASPADGAELQSRSATPSFLPYLLSVWERRHFVLALGTGQLRSQHLDTLLGNVWHVLNPVFLIGVYFVVFGLLIETNRGVDNFIAFLAIGIFSFSFSQRTAIACSSSIPNNLGLIRSLQFPRAVLPLATMLVELSSYLFGFGVMLVVLIATGEMPKASWVLAPVVMLGLTMFSTGFGLVLARVAHTVRDITQVIPYLFRIALYGSGIIFSIQAFVTTDRFGDPAAIRQLFILDPWFTYIDLLRHTLMTSYQAEQPGLEWLFVAVVSPLMLLVGLVVFRGGEKDYGRG